MSRNCKCGVGTFVAGLAIGIGVGVLFAPKKGSETREDLKNAFDDMVRRVKEIKPGEVKENIERKIAEIKMGLADLDKEKVLAIAKDKANALKEKCEELVAYAKEKGTPVIEKTAKELKARTANVVREVLVKLEG